MKIYTLAENTVRRPHLLAEHGLSLLIESREGTLLFDTGEGRALLPNAAKMGPDLEQVERIVLSHGHYDHTGGLLPLLERIGPREVFAHPHLFHLKYAVRGDSVRSIGLPASRESLEQAGARFCLHEEPVEILPGILASGPVPRETDFEEVSPLFQTSRGEEMVQDRMPDDQFLIAESGEGPVVLLGCAHAGLINSLSYARKLVGGRRFAGVIGGTHLIEADEVRLQYTLEAIREFDIGRIAPCHCTGFRAQVALWEAFGERFVLNGTGDLLEFGGPEF